jgi:ABC-2 type transport system permease protein
MNRADTAAKGKPGGTVAGVREFWGGVGFVERNFALVKRYAGWEVVFVAYGAVNSIIIGLIGKATGDARLVLYLIIGSILWVFLSSLFHEVSESVAWEHWEGTLELTFMAPIKRLTMLLGTSAYAVIYGLARSLIILLAMLVFFNINLTGANLPAAGAVLLVSSVSFLGLGIAAAVLPILSRERGPQATHIFQALILLVSGVYYPIDVLPVWLRPISVISPATYALRSIRACLLDGAGFREVKGDILILAVFSVVSVPVGFLIFWAGETWAKRKGKIKIEG